MSNSVEVFKKFFRCPEAISKSPNGLGIGLFIAKNFVKLHGGDIWFENKEEGGTNFLFSIPLN